MSFADPKNGALDVAIVGSGPSGFYAAEAIFESNPDALVTMYERLPVPFGLVRYGVAPDHPKLKSPTLIFERIAQHPNFRFFGNALIGRDLSVQELSEHHHATIFAYGAETDRCLGIAGEGLPGSHAATAFVGWYNGHPDFRESQFNLSSDSVAIIGQGNVAVDVARILTLPVDQLASTDIASHAVEALRLSQVQTVYIIGRRGPAQAKFTTQELRELGEIPDVQIEIRLGDLDLNLESLTELQERKNFLAAKNVEILRKWAATAATEKKRRIVFYFLESPVQIIGRNRVEGLILERNRLCGSAFAQQAESTGDRYALRCGLVFRSIGYKGTQLPGLPFDASRGILPNASGRVLGHAGAYTTGWIKRGPSGIIGTNRACAVETVATLVRDFSRESLPKKDGSDATKKLLASRGVQVVSYSDWKRIDAEEVRRGKERGKPREKFSSVDAMLNALNL